MHELAYLRWKKSMFFFFVLLIVTLVADRRYLFLILNGGAMVLPDQFWAIVTNLGDGFMAALALLFVAAKRPDMIRAALVATAIALPFAQGGKILTTVIRPGFIIPEAHVIGHLPGSWSFPSGHTTTVALIFGVIFLMADLKRWRWFSFAIIIFAGFSRIAVGVHWPIDVACGWIVGLSSAAAGVLLTTPERLYRLKTAIVPVILTALSLVFTVAYGMNPRIPVIQELFGITVFLFGLHASITIIKGATAWKR